MSWPAKRHALAANAIELGQIEAAIIGTEDSQHLVENTIALLMSMNPGHVKRLKWRLRH